MLGCAVNRDTQVWIGPTTPEAVLEDFLNIFGVACMMEADQFIKLDTQANRQKLLGELGAERGLFCSADKFEDVDLQSLLCPSGKRHWNSYKALLQASGSARVGAMMGTFVADLSQNPEERRSRCGAWFPALTRSSLIASLTQNAFFTNAELDFVMGFPSLPEQIPACSKYAEGMPPALQVHLMDRAEYRKLTGNGQHVASFSAFLLYMFANCVRRSDLERICFPIPRPEQQKEDVR